MKKHVISYVILVLLTWVFSCEKPQDLISGEKESISYYFTLNENAPAGTVLGTVEVPIAMDGQPGYYAITEGDPDGAFKIDPSNGEISVLDSTQIDYEIHPEFNLLIEFLTSAKCSQPNMVRVLVEILDSNEISKEKLVASYPLDGNAEDISGNLLHGEAIGTFPYYNRYAEEDKALWFNGTSDYIVFPNEFDLRKKTICFWFKAEDVPEWNADDPANSVGVLYCSDHSRLRFGPTKVFVTKVAGEPKICFYNGGQSADLDYSYSISEGQWYFAALTVFRRGITYYLNAEEIGSGDFPPRQRPTEYTEPEYSTAGVASSFDKGYFKGRIDDLKVYSDILSPQEIINIYKEKEETE
ncbi:MAG: cadherin domain-containing protein [Bacteroidales bacterium]|nr:cadherin domain-containing protein [Bacteroidales bacterium]